jgi:photosystem II stability/assembly factor-like uncharacterized protein
MRLYFKIIFLFSFSFIFAQNVPNKFEIEQTTYNKLKKFAGSTPLSNSITQIVTVGDTVWVGTSKGVSVSYDNGNNWRDFYKTEPFGEEGAISMGYYENKFWVATGHTEVLNDEDVNVGSGIKFTADGGETWVSIPQSVDDPGDSSIVYGINNIRALPVTVTPQNINWDMSFSPGKIWVASWSGGIRWNYIDSLINNQNSKWHRVILPPDYLDKIELTDTLSFSLQNAKGKFGPEEYLNHLGFSVFCLGDSLVYAGTAGGLNISKDGGISWQKMNHQNQKYPMSGNWIIDIVVEEDHTIWLSSWKANGETEYYGLSMSQDEGESWQTYFNGDKIYYPGVKYSPSGSEIFIPTESNGIYRSRNKGTTWLKNPTITDDETNLKLLTSTFFTADVNRGEDNLYNIWIGSDNGLVKLTEAEQSNWQGQWKLYISSPEIKVGSESIAFPNPFSPDVESVKIKYSFNGSSQNVTLRIFDFGMNLVRTVTQNASRLGNQENIENWNGRDENSEIVPNGVYFYRLDIGSNEPLYGKIMVVM